LSGFLASKFVSATLNRNTQQRLNERLESSDAKTLARDLRLAFCQAKHNNNEQTLNHSNELKATTRSPQRRRQRRKSSFELGFDSLHTLIGYSFKQDGISRQSFELLQQSKACCSQEEQTNEHAPPRRQNKLPPQRFGQTKV
jgi:hypothetical protein